MSGVGLVTPQRFDHPYGFVLTSGQTLPGFHLMYETYGELNAQRDNAILVCHALSGDHHVAGRHRPEDKHPGWWDCLIGPNRPLDTRRFFIVCCNNLGGCGGSSGPNQINPVTKTPFGMDFPIVTVADWVNSQRLLMNYLAIPQWYGVVGGSLGGMQALHWAVHHPHRLQKAVVIAATDKLSAENIAFNEIGRSAILNDPDFAQGHYYATGHLPWRGLQVARMIGHVTYYTESALQQKFGRKRREKGDYRYHWHSEFEMQHYLQYKAAQFAKTFDANSYLLMSKALDYFDLSADFNHDLSQAMTQVKANCCVIAFDSDWRFPPSCSQRLVAALKQADASVVYHQITSDRGHDSFLLPLPDYLQRVQQFISS